LAGFSNVLTVRQNSPHNFKGHAHSEKHFSGCSEHFPALLAIAARQSKTTKRRQNRTANPLGNVYVSYLLICFYFDLQQKMKDNENKFPTLALDRDPHL